jgi:hypothetical protein
VEKTYGYTTSGSPFKIIKLQAFEGGKPARKIDFLLAGFGEP